MIITVVRHSVIFGNRTWIIRDSGNTLRRDPHMPWLVEERNVLTECSSLEVAMIHIAKQLEEEGQP